MASRSMRHFSALMRKNWIIYKRNPCTAVCQILTTLFFMLIMVWLRTTVTTTKVDAGDLLKLAHPIYSLESKNNEYDVLSGFKLNDIQTTRALSKQYEFANYLGIFDVEFEVLQDAQSPIYFDPPNCSFENEDMKQSTIIAVVGQTNSVTDAVQEYLKALLMDTKYYKRFWWQPYFVYYQTEQELNDYIASDTYLNPDMGVCFGFQITKNDRSNWEVSLYFDDQAFFDGYQQQGIPRQTNRVVWDGANKPDLQAYTRYTTHGYTFIQNVIATMLLKEATATPEASISALIVPQEMTTLEFDKFAELNVIFGNMIALLYVLPVFNTVFFIVKEKEQRMKESMRMMGLSDLPYWMSWFVYYSILNTMTAFLASLVLQINVLPNTSFGMQFLMIWGYGQALFGEIFFMQAMFKKSKYAGILATVVYFLIQSLNLFMAGRHAPKLTIKILSIFPQVAMFQIVYTIFEFESVKQGLTIATFWQPFGDNNCGYCFICYVIGFVLFMLVGLYLETVLPSEYGSHKHPCFMFFPSTYRCRRQVDQDTQNSVQEPLITSQTDNLELQGGLKPENYEPASTELQSQESKNDFLCIQDLQKIYSNGFHAVRGLNLKMYKNQIFALLGQNGAGKSTTISMLTGLLQKTEGAAKVFGFDMFNETAQVRQFMGVCPQHDVLFDQLTPIEHLQTFYDFKGADPAKRDREIVDLIRDVGLEQDQHKVAGSLSGGNRRKLSVAIAMCGGSKLVLLDEPTAGMDLGARRALWDMLKNYRNDRIIILTTHYMDEADVLGDRIAIMAKGQMKCLGSSLFLKKRFGAGYKLTMVKREKEQNKLILPYLHKNLGKGAELIQEVSSEISVGVPEEAESQFTQFFKQFDYDIASLGVLSYGISITTLEEVFLHINKELNIELQMANADPTVDDNVAIGELERNLDDLNQERNLALNQSEVSDKARFSKITTDDGQYKQTTECQINESSMKSNVQALLTKRFNLYKRDKIGIACEVFIPFFMVLVGCILTQIDLNTRAKPRLITPTAYPSQSPILMNEQTVFNTGENTISPMTLSENLPGGLDYFNVKFSDTNSSYTDYYELTFTERAETKPFSYGSYQIIKADNGTKQFFFNSFVNLTSQDVTAFYPQFMYESILKTATGNPEFQFQVTTVTYPALTRLTERKQQENSVVFSFMMGVALAIIPCSMISFLLKERMESLKHMQLVSGMSIPAYWVSNMIADVIKVYIPMALIQGLSYLFNCNYPGVWVLLLVLPWGLVPFTYLTSFLFTNDTNAQISTLAMSFLVCNVFAPMVFTLQGIPETFAIGDSLRWWFCVFPNYCVMSGIYWSAQGDIIVQERASQPQKYKQLPSDLWAFENLLGDVVILLLHFVIDSALICLIESDVLKFTEAWFRKEIPPPDLSIQVDSDVQKEAARVENANEVIRVNKFRKGYSKPFSQPFMAVENISFGLDYGECFALLGVNGAGKSTTFKSLTADVEPSEGQISVAGLDIQTQFHKVRKLIGYCPQHDAIFPLMTVEEHLNFYAVLKGVPQDKQHELIEQAIENMNLTEHRAKPAGTLSGGNKRKLSVAMATLGNPPIILLDEPSAGMDPEARRFMWQVVANISQRDKNSAVIITTHSMEEAEALSTKMGIMVRGGIFKCYGSTQHIKSKFGTGFEVDIKIRKPTQLDLLTLKDQMGFTQEIEDRVDLDRCKQIAHKFGVNKLLIRQIRARGLGADLYVEAQSGHDEVRLKNFVSYVYTLSAGLKVIECLCARFEQIELFEQCSDFFKMRIPRSTHTIGRLFGTLQENKETLQISEYSVSETSLEQIFQSFANSSSKSHQNCFLFKSSSSGDIQLAGENDDDNQQDYFEVK